MKYVDTIQFLDRRVSVGSMLQAAPVKTGYARGLKKIPGPPEVWVVEVIFPDGETRLISSVDEIRVLK
jgi:hypothetical protein